MNPRAPIGKQQIISGVLIALICVLVFAVATLVVPVLAHTTGFSEDSISYAAAGTVFVFTVGSGLWVRSIIEKNGAGGA
jgi:hypothetical protein